MGMSEYGAGSSGDWLRPLPEGEGVWALFVADYVYYELLGGGDPVVVLKPSVLSCITSSRNSMTVTPSAVWARMSLAMRNSSIPESTVRKSRVRVAGAFRVTATSLLSSAVQGSAGSGRPLME